jgi:hypothetical protein
MRGLRSRRVLPVLTGLLLLGQVQVLAAPWVLATHIPSRQSPAAWLRDHLPAPDEAAVAHALTQSLAPPAASRTALVASFAEALVREMGTLSPAWQEALEALRAAARLEDQQRAMPGLNGRATLPRTLLTDALSPAQSAPTRCSPEAILPFDNRQAFPSPPPHGYAAGTALALPVLHVVSAAQPLGP